MRGDATQRAAFYQAALGGARGETAYMTRNEVRELEDLNPIERRRQAAVVSVVACAPLLRSQAARRQSPHARF
jgi:phage portal protein BeeE